jgi:hypothetical protein
MPFSFRLFGLMAAPDKLPPDVLRAPKLCARHVDPENADFGNTLLPEAGEHLSGHSLRSLIRDEFSYDVAKAEIRENKKVFQRLGVLLEHCGESDGRRESLRPHLQKSTWMRDGTGRPLKCKLRCVTHPNEQKERVSTSCAALLFQRRLTEAGGTALWSKF